MQHEIIPQDLHRLTERCSVSIDEFESAMNCLTDWEVLLQMHSRFAVYDLILGAVLDAAMNRS